ncbi:Dicer-like protein 1, partial [Coemansia aciculifera]
MYSDRSRLLEQSNGDYAQWVGKVVMDGLDYGKLKVVERVCEDANIYTDLTAYHFGPDATPEPVVEPVAGAEQPAPEAANPTADNDLPHKSPSGNTGTTTKGGKDRVSVRFSVRKMADWAPVKRVTRMLRGGGDKHSVPLFKVRPVSLTCNYLVVAQLHPLSSSATEVDATDGALALSNAEKVIAYPDVIYSSPFFCAAEQIDLPMLNNLSLLPAFFVRLGHVLMAHAVRSRLDLRVRIETLRQALTTSSANLDTNYERLEILGDSVLKLVSSTMLFVAHPDDHEGLLTQRRELIVSNANLYTLARKLGLAESIISSTFNKREQSMPGRGYQRMS